VGYNIYQSNRAASAAESQGRIQQMLGLQAARQQAESGRMQSQIALAQAETQKRAGMGEAEKLRADARINAEMSVEEQRRQRIVDRKLQASQVAAQAASGLSTVGTPLEVMAETAGIQQLQIVETARQREVERRQILNQAQAAEYGASQMGGTAIDAQLQGIASIAQANQTRYNAMLAPIQAKLQGAQYRAQAIGSALSGISSMAGSAYQFGRQGAFTRTK
jgi:hypothetical protein